MSRLPPGCPGAVLVDAGGVLVRPSFARVAAALRERGVAADEAALAVAEPRARRELDRPPAPGLASDAERGWAYFDLVLAHAGIPRSAATAAALGDLRAFHDRENLWEDVLPGVREGLETLRSAGLRLAVVSNANGTVGRLLGRLGLAAAFEAVLDSQVEGVEKPDPRLFARALERLGVDARDALHVGDLYHVDVVGARAAGIRPVLVDEAGLYPDADCPRAASLLEVARRLAAAGGAVREFC